MVQGGGLVTMSIIKNPHAHAVINRSGGVWGKDPDASQGVRGESGI